MKTLFDNNYTQSGLPIHKLFFTFSTIYIYGTKPFVVWKIYATFLPDHSSSFIYSNLITHNIRSLFFPFLICSIPLVIFSPFLFNSFMSNNS